MIPISSINSNQTKMVEPVLLSEITYDLAVTEIVEEQDPYEKAIKEMQEEMKEIESIEDKKEWFLAYKKIINEYSEVIDPPETVYDYFTEEEIYLIQRTIETECYDKDFKYKCNVANVILNRIESKEFGNTVEEVITTESQFAYWRKDITDDTVLALEFSFSICDTTNGCVAFRSDKKVETWYSWSYAFSDDIGHHFYR